MIRRDENRRKVETDLEQYGRRNNLKISGIKETGRDESAKETATQVTNMLKMKNIYNLTIEETDIAHPF